MKRTLGVGLAIAVACAAACGDGDDDGAGGGGEPDAGVSDAGITGGTVEPFPALYCPGSEGCEDPGTGPLRVGAARASIVPELVETEWEDDNDNHHYDTGEAFTDVNGNGVFDAVWIAGFSNGRPATGVNDGLWVRAMVLERGDTRVALAVVDCVGWFNDEITKARDQMPASLALDHVIIASTHVHEGVDTLGLWGRKELVSGAEPAYQALVRQATVDAVADAVAALEPVTMSVAQVLTVDESGSARPYVSDVRDPVIFDPRLTLARFAREGEPETTVATLVHWAAHPEYGGSRNNLLSADYVHWLRDGIENGVPETAAGAAAPGLGGEVVFLNGAFGGQVGPGAAEPIGPDGQPITEDGLAMAEAAGTNVARLGLEAITRAEGVVDVAAPGLSFRTGELFVLVENVFYHVAGIVGVFERRLYGYDESQPIDAGNLPYLLSRVSYLQVGNVGIATAPGELHPELLLGAFDGSESWGADIIHPDNPNPPNLAAAPDGPYLRELILGNDGVAFPLVLGAGEDFLGYIVPAYNYELDPSSPYISEAEGDHYEETNSVGPQVEAQVVGAMRELLEWRAPND